MERGPASMAERVAVTFAATAFYRLFGGLTDVALLLILLAWRNWQLVSGAVDPVVLSWAAGVVRYGVLYVVGYRLLQRLRSSAEQTQWEGLGKPLILPCRTTHTRMFPKVHSFSYSYLVVGIPVGWEGSAGAMVSSGFFPGQDSMASWLSAKRTRTKAWFHVDPSNYLERGNAHLGLRGKLDEYLRSQNHDPSKYPHAYLITAPTFMGYQFNPVSFWYLYDSSKTLSAMILEVNNTFDERRMYFLPSDEGPMPDQPKATDEVASTLNKLGEPVKLRRRWPKDFHVSPFNSRKGAYTLTAVDPLDPSTLGVSPVNNTINLRSSKDRSKLVARLFSEGPAVDPQIMPLWQKVFFVARWWWVGLVTFPRILLEAAKLFFQRKLHVWYRPEPLRQSIGRWADATERRLERVFRLYLRHLVAHSSSVSGRGLTVRYVPSGLDDARSEVMRSAAAVDRTSTTATTRPATDAVEPVQEAPAEELEIKVLTPAFYSRFVYYAHDYEAFFDELRLNETVWLSRPELLPRLVLKRPAGAAPVTTSSIVDFLIFAAIRRLRRRPERIVRPLTSSGPLSASASAAPGHATQSIDVRDFRLSSMDGFVLEHADASTRRTYGREVVRLFVADRIAFGDVRILAAQMLALRAAVAWGVCRLVETLVCVA